MKTLQLLLCFILLSIISYAGPIDSVYWNKMSTPHTLYVRCWKPLPAKHTGGGVFFNSTKDTLIAQFHFLMCDGATADMQWDTLFVLTPSTDTPLYHLMVRRVWDTSTVIPQCYDTIPDTLQVYIGYNAPLSSSQIQEAFSGLSCYPNPVSDRLRVKGVSPGTRVSIGYLDGRIVWQGAYPAEGLPVHHWHEGMYLLWVHTEHPTRPLKWIKKNE